MRRSALFLALATTLMLCSDRLVSAEGCSRGGQGGGQSRVIGGTYPSINPDSNNGSNYGSCSQGTHQGAPYGQDREYDSGYESAYGADRLLDETFETGGPWSVSVQHPVSGQFAELNRFDRRSEALRYVEKIRQRFFVTYRAPGDDRLQFREAKTSSAASLLADELRRAGHQVSLARAVTRIDEVGADSLLDDLPLLGPTTQTSALPVARRVEAPVVRQVPVAQPVEPASPSDSVPGAATEEQRVADPDAAEAAQEYVLDPALQALVGTWTAVARYGDGELGTVELQLDNRGWARLTVPQADGDDATVERRAVIDQEELQLHDDESKSRITLGKLVSVDASRLVLQRAGGQTTFVRP